MASCKLSVGIQTMENSVCLKNVMKNPIKKKNSCIESVYSILQHLQY
jgi:hypothetical protein